MCHKTRHRYESAMLVLIKIEGKFSGEIIGNVWGRFSGEELGAEAEAIPHHLGVWF